MKRRHVLSGLSGVAAAAVIGSPAAAHPGASMRRDPETATTAAKQALQRLLPDHHDQFTIAVSASDDADSFSVDGDAGALEVAGATPAAALAGVNWYLKHVAGVDVSWPGSSLSRLPDQLPGPDSPIARTATVPRRFALNDTHDGYTGPFRTWTEWERDLDLMAAHGYNEVLITVGMESVYQAVFTEFGYSDDEVRVWLPLPAHQPWFLMQNLHSFPSPNSAELMQRRLEQAQHIVARTVELGMTPVLTGYFGHVPPEFADRNPAAEVVPQGEWYGFDRPDWLDPRNEIFAEVAEVFYRKQAELFGEADAYKMDLLHEGGDPGDVPPADAAVAVMDALQTARPGASWVLIGWRENPMREILDAVDSANVFIVDGLSDRHLDLDREDDWGNTPYAFGSIPNFGGRTTLGGNAATWAQRFPQWRDADDSAVIGTAWMPEGAGRDPAAFELFGELAWHDTPIELDEWFAGYADRRYGGEDSHARAAWEALRTTAYAMPEDDEWSEPQDGLFTARPHLSADRTGNWSPRELRYDNVAFDRALDALVDVDPALHTDSYRYDVVDVARQSLTNAARVLLPRVKTAFDTGDADGFDDLTDTWLLWMDLLDRLLASDERFLLGPWLEAAKAAAADDEEAAALEYNARVIVTVWGARRAAESGLRDYGNRELSGLVSDFYAPRWREYFDALARQVGVGEPVAPIDWFDLEDEWTQQRDSFPADPAGDPVELAREVRDTLAAAVNLAELAVAAQQPTVEPGETVEIEATFRNANGFTAAHDVAAAITGPSHWTFEADGAVDVERLDPGEELTVRWRATAGSDAPETAMEELLVEVTHRFDDVDSHTREAVRILRPDSIDDPWSTVSFNDASFAVVDGEIAIHGGGSDMWGGTNEFGAVYQAGALSDGGAITAKVTWQDVTGTWARAGLVVRNDLETDGAGGFADLAVTPGNGCVLGWDSTGDGRLNSDESVLGSAPMYLRLRREGTQLHGEHSLDGEDWELVGVAEMDHMDEQLDVGVFMSAANASGVDGAVGVAAFTDIEIS